MSPQFPAKNGESIKWLDYLNYLIYMSATLEEKLAGTVLDIFNALLMLQGTYNGSYVSIAWDGTSKCVYHGTRQLIIAGKPMIIDTLETQLKKENITESEIESQILWGYVSNSTLETRMTGKSASALTLQGARENPLTATLMSDGETISLCLELPRPQLE